MVRLQLALRHLVGIGRRCILQLVQLAANPLCDVFPNLCDNHEACTDPSSDRVCSCKLSQTAAVQPDSLPCVCPCLGALPTAYAGHQQSMSACKESAGRYREVSYASAQSTTDTG